MNDKRSCDPHEVAVKSFFLGPAAENAEWLESVLKEIFQQWYDWRRRKYAEDGVVITEEDRRLPEFLAQQEESLRVIRELMVRFEGEIPKFSPRYLGHMFSEVSMPALLGHFMTLLHNPNNISPESSRVGTGVEIEAIDLLRQMVGYPGGHGHFTSGGTIANFEFLFRARERLARWLATALSAGEKNHMVGAHAGWALFDDYHRKLNGESIEPYYWLDGGQRAIQKITQLTGRPWQEPILFVPNNKHYSWPKAMHYLGLGESQIRYIELDRFGRACPRSLQKQLDRALLDQTPMLGVVGVAGTTEMGTIDPLEEFSQRIQQLKQDEGLHLWFHVDGAYGGFFRSLVKSSEPRETHPHFRWSSLEAIAQSDSVTLDPHKLGYVPYSSGAFLCQSERDYFIRPSMGPYIVTDDRTLGNFTLEGSRSAAGAVATYASLKSFDSICGYSKILKRTLLAKEAFEQKLRTLPGRIFIPGGLDTNLLCFVPVGNLQKLSDINRKSRVLYQTLQAKELYWISKTTLSDQAFGALIQEFCQNFGIVSDEDQLVLLRLTLMNPFILTKESPVDHVESFCELLAKESSPSP